MSDDIKPSIIKIETLEKEYIVVLKQYEEYYNTYINNLKTQSEGQTSNTNTNTNTNTTEFVELKGRTYWGKYGLKEASIKTAKECETMCASDLTCTGATFNQSKRYCWTRAGDGNITAGSDTDIAIIPKLRQDLSILKRLNEKLIYINMQINNELDKIYPIVEEDIRLKNKKQKQLKNYYGVLLDEKIKLEKTLREYETIEEQYENNFLSVVSQNSSLRVWTLISLIVFFITFKNLLGKNTNPNMTVIFWMVILILFIALSTNLTTPQGFMMWTILLLIVFLVKINIIPLP